MNYLKILTIKLKKIIVTVFSIFFNWCTNTYKGTLMKKTTIWIYLDHTLKIHLKKNQIVYNSTVKAKLF